MFAEGLQLYQQIVKVFNSSLKMKQVYCFAWGMPTLLIVCSLGIAGNHQDGFSSLVSKDLCWLSVQNRLIWVFIVPVFVLILGNLVILGMVIKELNKVDKSSDSLLSTFRTNLKAFGLLSPLLGITWLTGLLCILGVGVVGLYLFTILNSSQVKIEL
ncbi:adhesion G-protein coupled receptor D1 [Exaiptasia diaphana]|uniref:G-protein coupled receptors family 2 profile 2 domain-containing protein n=1 Tax=Exaiptasia diaphana TaxID=2652724 RepID=A0A913YRZ1_EXADI|nr:adhesion G-protein coupled receptor D1 [Exaiptasia diaphana]